MKRLLLCLALGLSSSACYDFNAITRAGDGSGGGGADAGDAGGGGDDGGPADDLTIPPPQHDLRGFDLVGSDFIDVPPDLTMVISSDGIVVSPTDFTLPADSGVTNPPDQSFTTFDLARDIGTTPSPDQSLTPTDFMFNVPDGPPPTLWTKVTSPTTFNLSGVWCGGPVVIVVGDGGTILRSTDSGASFSLVTGAVTANSLRAVYAFNLNDVNAVGAGGTILTSLDGGMTWSAAASGVTDDLLGVWGGAGGEAYAVGANGRILHRKTVGGAWADDGNGTTGTLRAISAFNLGDLYVVGDSNNVAMVLHKGATGGWGAPVPDLPQTGRPMSLHGVTASGTEVCAVGSPVGGGNAAIYHINFIAGSPMWMPQNSSTFAPLDGTWSSASGAFAVGVNGTVVHTINGGNTWMIEPTGRSENLRAVQGNGNNVFAVGDNGLILRR